MKQAAIYLRVSTDRQDNDNQRPEVEQLVRSRGAELVAVYEEKVSGTARVRPAFDRMMLDARAGQLDMVAVWAMDRFGRSLVGNLGAVLELDRLNVQLVSVREPWLDTGGPVRSLLVAIFSWVAEQEAVVRRERTRAGLDKARRKGTKLGRPPTSFLRLAAAAKAKREGKSVREACKAAGVSQAALYRWLADPRRAT
jgi:DNA invertase Pin-like site-specific DNA recombinase